MTMTEAFRLEPLPLNDDRRVFLPIAERWRDGDHDAAPAALVTRWSRTRREPEAHLRGFHYWTPEAVAFIRMEREAPERAKTYVGSTSGCVVPLLADDEMLLDAGGRIVVTDLPALYGWIKEGWWPNTLTTVQPARKVVFPDGTDELIRWPRSLDYAEVRLAVGDMAPIGLLLLWALPADEWSLVVAQKGAMTSGLSSPAAMKVAPVLGGRLHAPAAAALKPTPGGRSYPPPLADVARKRLAFHAASLITQAQVRLSEIMRPWLDAWAEALPYAPGLMLGHFLPWLVQAQLFRRSGWRKIDMHTPSPTLADELHDIGVPLEAARQLVALPERLRLPSSDGPDIRSGPFEVSNNAKDLKFRRRLFEANVDGHRVFFPVNWDDHLAFLPAFAAQQRIVLV